MITRFLLLLLLAAPARAQFKTGMWWSVWDNRDYATYNAVGCHPWLVDFTGTNIIIYFDNGNVNDNAAPYWAYRNKGDAFADSATLWWGASGTPYNYVDSLTTIGHRYGAAVVMTIQCVNTEGGYFNTISADSAKVEAFCDCVSKWCQLYHFDGVDFNYEYQPKAARTYLARFLRRLRANMNANITSVHGGLARPWLSITDAYTMFAAQGDVWEPGDTAYVDMWWSEQGTSSLMFNGNVGGSNKWYNWFDCAIRIEGTVGGATAFATANSINLETLSEDSPYNAGEPTGVRNGAYHGFPKSHLGIWNGIGGGTVYQGSDTAGGYIPNIGIRSANVSRGRLYNLLHHGGAKHYDPNYQASFISGTANADISDPPVSNGTKFFCPYTDSTDAYLASKWLQANGYAGIAMWAADWDFDSSVVETAPWSQAVNRFPGYKGLVGAAPGYIPPVTNPNRSGIISRSRVRF